MGIDKSMIMVFEGGPHGNCEMEWTIDGKPPPETHSFLEGNKVSLYERDTINPGKKTIEYIYSYKGERQTVQQ